MQGGIVHSGGRGTDNRGGRGNNILYKEYWKDMEFFNCNNKGHPSISCPEAENNANDASTSSRSSQAKSVTKLTKDFKKMKKLLYRYSSYKSHTLTFLIMMIRKKSSTFRLQRGD